MRRGAEDPDMTSNHGITRLTLVPHSTPGDELRRYRLARLDEVALATPPYPGHANGGPPRRETAGSEAKRPPDARARRA